VTWQVLTLPEFDAWFDSLDQVDRRALDAKVGALEQLGPLLGRPHADTVEGSKHSNMKELRARETVRAFYAFDPKRRAILLIGGDKKGDKQFYDRMIAKADDLYERYLESIGDEEGER
jgi:hypothetical protein